MVWDSLLADMFYQLAQPVTVLLVLSSSRRESKTKYVLHREAVFHFRRRVEAGIQKTDPGTDHSHLQAQVGEVVQEFLQRNILHLKSIPDPVDGDFTLLSHVFALWTANRLAESKEWKRKIHEAVLVLLDILLAIDQLVELKGDQPSYKGSSCSDGWDNLASNKLGFMPIGLRNVVVLCTEITGRRNKVNVMIGVIVLLKLYWVQPEPSEGFR